MPPSKVIFISLEISQCPISTVSSDHDRDDRESQHITDTTGYVCALILCDTLE